MIDLLLKDALPSIDFNPLGDKFVRKPGEVTFASGVVKPKIVMKPGEVTFASGVVKVKPGEVTFASGVVKIALQSPRGQDCDEAWRSYFRLRRR